LPEVKILMNIRLLISLIATAGAKVIRGPEADFLSSTKIRYGSFPHQIEFLLYRF